MFLLVPAHPGCPGQIPQSRKMVVCVCENNKGPNILPCGMPLSTLTKVNVHYKLFPIT